MLTSLIAVALIGFAIGISLGLLGGGGSILTVPALVYLVGQSPQVAITTALAIVSANSALGAWFHRQHGTLRWKIAAVFGGAGMLAAYPMANLSKRLPGDVLLVAFAVLMLIVAAVMLLRRGADDETAKRVRGWPGIVAGGLLVGSLTGLLGVGGGFLIVPALVVLVRLSTKEAIGTSLAVIALNSFAALVGHMGSSVDWALTLGFVAAGLGGTWSGARLGQRLPASQLRQLFAVFVTGIGLYMLIDTLPRLFS